MKPFKIDERWVGPGHPCYIVAELSANHRQSFDRAMELIKAAKEAGANAVKLQTYTPDTMTIDSDAKWFRIDGNSLWAGRTLYQLYEEAYTPWEWQPKLKNLADALGLHCLSSPFDETAVEFLEKMNTPAYKVASFELIDLPLLRRIARTGKPVIASIGMASLAEIEEAVHTLRQSGTRDLALLKCTSAYPAAPEEINLRTIPHLAEAFHVVTGLSDHTLEVGVPVAAVALSACIIEKHFTLARADGGPDAAFSLEPTEFKAMVDSVRKVERALGSVSYQLTHGEKGNTLFRRSLFAVQDIRAGERFTERNVRSIRPGDGLPPRYWDKVLGSLSARDIRRGTPLRWSDLIVDSSGEESP